MHVAFVLRAFIGAWEVFSGVLGSSSIGRIAFARSKENREDGLLLGETYSPGFCHIAHNS